MASRPTAQIATRLARTVHVRRLSITGPATYPSQVLTQSKPSQISNNGSSIGSDNAATESAATSRQFNTSRSLKAVKDTSTIDFAYLPDMQREDIESTNEQRFSVPLLLSTMYTGSKARAMHEDEPESVVEPLISLVAASGTHISMPSVMSDVHDNNAVEFEGIAAPAQTDGADAAAAPPQVSDFRRLVSGVLDDILGPKQSAAPGKS